MDSTIVRAHQHSAGARTNAGPQAIGRPRGALSYPEAAGAPDVARPHVYRLALARRRSHGERKGT